MPDYPSVHSAEEAVQVLLAHQARTVGMHTQPAWGLTEETAAGWAFFNANGYLGTVTEDGDVVAEPEFGEDD